MRKGLNYMESIHHLPTQTPTKYAEERCLPPTPHTKFLGDWQEARSCTQQANLTRPQKQVPFDVQEHPTFAIPWQVLVPCPVKQNIHPCPPKSGSGCPGLRT